MEKPQLLMALIFEYSLTRDEAGLFLSLFMNKNLVKRFGPFDKEEQRINKLMNIRRMFVTWESFLL